MKKSVILFSNVQLNIRQCTKSFGQRVPTVVKSALQKSYPNAKEIKWEKEKTIITEAEFEVNETDYSILIDVSGNIIETEIEIKLMNFLPNAKHTFLKLCRTKIKETAKLPTAKTLLPTKQKSKAKT